MNHGDAKEHQSRIASDLAVALRSALRVSVVARVHGGRNGSDFERSVLRAPWCLRELGL